jgi:hypothetical protein
MTLATLATHSCLLFHMKPWFSSVGDIQLSRNGKRTLPSGFRSLQTEDTPTGRVTRDFAVPVTSCGFCWKWATENSSLQNTDPALEQLTPSNTVLILWWPTSALRETLQVCDDGILIYPSQFWTSQSHITTDIWVGQSVLASGAHLGSATKLAISSRFCVRQLLFVML